MNGRRLGILILVSIAFLSLGMSPVQARSAGCYTPAEYEAEQALRIHSQLMVIGLTCQRMPGSGGIYAKYSQFTKANQSILRGYEDEIIAHFANSGSPNPEKDFHALRTSMANDVSSQALAMRVDRFCRQYMPVLSKALKMNRNEVRQWAASAQSGTSLPLCQRVAAKN